MKKRIICVLVMLCLLWLSVVYINEKPDEKVFDKVQSVSINFLPGAGKNMDHLDNDYFYDEDQIRLRADAKYQEFESYEEENLDLNIFMVKPYERGKLYKLSVDSAEELPEERRNIYFYVTDSKIYRVWSYIEWKGSILSFYDNDLLLTIFLNTDEKLINNSEVVCQTEDCSSNLKTGEPGTHFGIKNTGGQIAYSRCDVKPNGEPGFYEQFVWENGKGLVYYESGYGAERDLLRLSNISDVREVSEKTIADLMEEASNYDSIQLEETDSEDGSCGIRIIRFLT